MSKVFDFNINRLLKKYNNQSISKKKIANSFKPIGMGANHFHTPSFFNTNKLLKKYRLKRIGGRNDWDGDGIPNWKDCQPFNVMRQDPIYSIRPFREKYTKQIIPTDMDKDYLYNKKTGEYKQERYRSMNNRGTGWFGSGIYGFRTKKQAEEALARQKPGGAYYGYIREFEIKKPFKPRTAHESDILHTASKELYYFNLKKPGMFSNKKWLKDRFKHIGLDVSEDDILKAKKKSNRTGAQPINELLKLKGYDGVIPDDKYQTFSYGSVKFASTPKQIPLDKTSLTEEEKKRRSAHQKAKYKQAIDEQERQKEYWERDLQEAQKEMEQPLTMAKRDEKGEYVKNEKGEYVYKEVFGEKKIKHIPRGKEYRQLRNIQATFEQMDKVEEDKESKDAKYYEDEDEDDLMRIARETLKQPEKTLRAARAGVVEQRKKKIEELEKLQQREFGDVFTGREYDFLISGKKVGGGELNKKANEIFNDEFHNLSTKKKRYLRTSENPTREEWDYRQTQRWKTEQAVKGRYADLGEEAYQAFRNIGYKQHDKDWFDLTPKERLKIRLNLKRDFKKTHPEGRYEYIGSEEKFERLLYPRKGRYKDRYAEWIVKKYGSKKKLVEDKNNDITEQDKESKDKKLDEAEKLTLYHGTSKRYGEDVLKAGKFNRGVFLTPSKLSAYEYSKSGRGEKGERVNPEGGKVLAVTIPAKILTKDDVHYWDLSGRPTKEKYKDVLEGFKLQDPDRAVNYLGVVLNPDVPHSVREVKYQKIAKDKGSKDAKYYHGTSKIGGVSAVEEVIKTAKQLKKEMPFIAQPEMSEKTDKEYIYVFTTPYHAKTWADVVSQRTGFKPEVLEVELSPEKLEKDLDMPFGESYKHKGPIPAKYVKVFKGDTVYPEEK